MIDVYIGTGNGALPFCATRSSLAVRVYVQIDSNVGGRIIISARFPSRPGSGGGDGATRAARGTGALSGQILLENFPLRSIRRCVLLARPVLQ